MGIVTKGIPADITLELAGLNGSSIFVETGTYHAKTTRWAAGHFESVHTIERSQAFYDRYKAELAKLDGVTPHFGDSRSILPGILHEIGKRSCVLWLDGHWMGGATGGEGDECPLLDELACLSQRLQDIILIDDARLFLSAPPAPHDASQWPTIAEIVLALPESGRSHFVQVVDDVIFAVPDQAALKNCLLEFARTRSNQFWTDFLKLQRT